MTHTMGRFAVAAGLALGLMATPGIAFADELANAVATQPAAEEQVLVADAATSDTADDAATHESVEAKTDEAKAEEAKADAAGTDAEGEKDEKGATVATDPTTTTDPTAGEKDPATTTDPATDPTTDPTTDPAAAPTTDPTEEPAVDPVPTGWQRVDGKWYLYDEKGQKSTGLVTWQGHLYLFDAEGTMLTGFFTDPATGTKYYAYASGVVAQDDTYQASQNVYASDDEGEVVTNEWFERGNSRYYAGSDGGPVRSQWVKAGGPWHYVGSDGAELRNQWVHTDGDWYYMGSDGAATLNGWAARNGNWYYLGGMGTPLKNGWVTIGGKGYYFASDGVMMDTSSWYKRQAQGMSSKTKYLIFVDYDSCRVIIFQRYGTGNAWNQLYNWVCSPGAYSMPTVHGTFEGAQYKAYSFGQEKGYTAYYATQIYGEYLFHSILYYKNSFRVMDGTLGDHRSHGCVRLDINNAKWIYYNIPAKTKVWVF